MNTQNLLDAEYNRLDKQIRVIEDSIGKCPEELIVLSLSDNVRFNMR